MLKGSRSLVIMCCSCPLHPLSVTNDAMTRPDPIVKQMANFEGASMMTGRKSEKARSKKIKPAPRIAAK